MSKIKSLQLIVVILIAAFTGYYFGINRVKVSWENYKPSVAVIKKETPPALRQVDFSLFWNVWNKLESNYYDKTKLDPTKMLNGAITGLTQSLDDPYTMFLPPNQNANFKDGLAGQFSGIGAELGTREKQIIVIAPLTGSAAQKAGLKAGDMILKVDDESTFDWTLPFTVSKIRGPKGTIVTLSILHKDSEKPLDVKIVRDIITVKSVAGRIKTIKEIENINPTTSSGQAGIKGRESDKVAYIRLSQFGDSTNNDWVDIIGKFDLQMQADKTILGLIVDLRNNPGGYLNDAIFIASEFLKQGTPVVIEDNGQGKSNIRSVSRVGLLNDTKLVVLINKGSASASEILSGALRDNKINGKSRAILIGETSFGKGTIQEAQDL